MIPLLGVHINGDNQQIFDLPIVGSIRAFNVSPYRIDIAVDNMTDWPYIPSETEIDPTKAMRLWVITKYGYTWKAAVAEALVYNPHKDEFIAGFYNTCRWSPLSDYIPRTRERIGFMLVIGQSRTAVTEFEWSEDLGLMTPLWYEGSNIHSPSRNYVAASTLPLRIEALEQHNAELRARMEVAEAAAETLKSQLAQRGCRITILGISIPCKITPAIE